MGNDRPILYGDHPLWQRAKTSWIQSDKGINLRLARWDQGDRGTVHIFNGRTEYIEKYADVIERLLARGFSVTAHDWRGQGLSTRNDRNPNRCHVYDFSEFQNDTHAIMAALADMPAPRRLFCHSMGGAIGLRYLMGKHQIESVVLSAPMWGIYVPLLVRPFVNMILNYVNSRNKLWALVPGVRDAPYESYQPFWNNLLTRDREAYFELRENVENHPELGLGGPNFHWFMAAKKELKWLHQAKLPKLPMLTFLGTAEKIVAPRAIREMAAKSPNIELVELKNAKHEVYLERPEIREILWDHIDRFWAING